MFPDEKIALHVRTPGVLVPQIKSERQIIAANHQVKEIVSCLKLIHEFTNSPTSPRPFLFSVSHNQSGHY